MVSVQKINFKANTPNLVQQMVATNPTPLLITSPSSVQTPSVSKDEQSLKTAKTVSYVSAGVALIALGVVAGMSLKNGKLTKEVKESDKLISGVKTLVKEEIDKLGKKVDENMEFNVGWLKANEEKIVNVDTKLNNMNKGSISSEDMEKINARFQELENKTDSNFEFSKGWLKANEERIANVSAQKASYEKNIRGIDGLNLLQAVDNDGRRIELPQDLKARLNGLAEKIINGGPNAQQTKVLGPDDVTWSIASEAIPEKEGGVGEVAVQKAVNMKRELGIDNYLLKPLYEIKGRSAIVESKFSKKFTYFFDLDKAKKYKMEVKKVLEFDMPVYHKGRVELQTVSVFSGVDPKSGVDTLMFKNSEYMGTTGFYKDSQTAFEKERFAFFPSAIYEFLKLKKDPNALASYKIVDQAEYEAIKAPNAIFANDWHAAAIAPLMKAKSLLEAHHGELNKNVAEELHTMCISNIGHNLGYQGADWRNNDEILNTLFGKYAYDLYENLNTNFNMNGLGKVLTLGHENHANLAHMGACLSNYMQPVSSNYALELANMGERSGAMQHLFKTRMAQGTMSGSGNGWDRAVNEVSEANLPSFLNNVNNDKFVIFKDAITSIKNIGPDVLKHTKVIFDDGLTAENFNMKVNALLELKDPEITKIINELKSNGVTKLRSYMPYTYKDTLGEILEARKFNKSMLLDYAQSMENFNKTGDKKLFNIVGLENTNLSKIKPQDLDNIPFIGFGVRFVTQKGVDVTADVLKTLLKNWDAKYPGKPRPVFFIGGADGEGGRVKQIMVDAKNELGKVGEEVFYMDGYAPNNIFHSGCDLTISPSIFEPDGSAWESLNKGTPVGATRVGGQVDSVKDGVNGYLAKEGLSNTDGMVDVMERFFEDFFNNKADYQKMIRATIDGDRSWVIKDKDGFIVGGALLKRLKHLNYDLSKFSQIKLTKAQIDEL